MSTKAPSDKSVVVLRDMKCGNCRAFFEDECRLNPPQVFWSDINETPYSTFPFVNEDAWCLKFYPKQDG